MVTSEVLKSLQRLIAITNTGLAYSQDPFDRERYQHLHGELTNLLVQVGNLDEREIRQLLRPTGTYVTPLLDVRGFVVQNGKVLLVKDSQSKEWSLPGGFCDVGFSPRENAKKEMLEETGYDTEVTHLLAVFDSNQFQPQGKQYIKLVFNCELKIGHFIPNNEVSDIAFFALDHLPKLSENRTTAEQLAILFKVYRRERDQYID